MCDRNDTYGVTSRSRDDAVKLAWSIWEHISNRQVEAALDILDDGTWWSASSRSETPMAQMKNVMREIYQIVPMTFEQVDAIVEGNRVAVMAESHADLPDGGQYNNVYTFVTTLHLDHDTIIGMREYPDTRHSSVTLIPALAGVVASRPGTSALTGMVQAREGRRSGPGA